MGDINGQLVIDHISGMGSPHREIILAIRGILLDADESIAEQIKWNSPSFFYTGEMKAFRANEYKRDLAVIRLHRGTVLLIFPTGNRIDERIPLKGQNYPDGRKIVSFEDLEEVHRNAEALTRAVLDWIGGIEK